MEDLRPELKKDFFKKYKIVILSVVSSVFFVLIIFSVIGFLVWYHRVEVFSFFANQYIKDVNQENEKILEPIEGENGLMVLPEEERKNVFSQDSMIVNAVKKTNPAVVSIILSKEVPKYETYVEEDPFFPGFFFGFPQYRQNGTEIKEIGGGSGFFVTTDGLIVTNKHVVDQNDVSYTVFTSDGKKYDASVVAKDPVLDIALIKIEGRNFPSLPLGNSDSLEVGQTVIAIGNALSEFKNTVSVGIISGLSRSLVAGDGMGKTEFLDRVIQTDAAINPGNSGGPLLNLRGEVVGVNVAVAQGSQNVGFALPVNSVKSAINSVKNTGKIIRPFLGIRYVSINKEMQSKNGLSVDYGILVKSGSNPSDLAVIPGSPADKAGIVENDIILEIDGIKIDDKNNFASIIRQKEVGQNIRLRMLSKGVEKIISVVLEPAKD